MGLLDRFIDAMDAASRRLEAKAALIRAEGDSEVWRYRAFHAGARAGVIAHAVEGLAPDRLYRHIERDALAFLKDTDHG